MWSILCTGGTRLAVTARSLRAEAQDQFDSTLAGASLDSGPSLEEVGKIASRRRCYSSLRRTLAVHHAEALRLTMKRLPSSLQDYRSPSCSVERYFAS